MVTQARSRPTPIPESEVEMTAMRAQGAGGQNVNKVSSAIHLRFDIPNSSLAPDHKERLLALADQRITRDGVLVIKAQSHRSQDMNRAEALGRLQELVDSVATPPRQRRATKPTAGSKRRRLEAKNLRSQVKVLRGPVSE
jgi:ribosome-associated protein